MASHMTHFYMAEKVLLRSGGKTREIMDDYSDCFYSGCQGNDVHFYSLFIFHCVIYSQIYWEICKWMKKSNFTAL